MTAPKNGWNLDIKALRRWIFSNWEYLEDLMRIRLGYSEDIFLEFVHLDGSYNLVTKRFSRPFLKLYPATSYNEYALFHVAEHPELAFLVERRIIINRSPASQFVFTRHELAHPTD